MSTKGDPGHAVTISLFSIFTATLDSGWLAGPCFTAPVSASNTEPWHGQAAWPFCGGFTVQPWCVQTALKHATVPADGCATSTSCPSGVFADFAWPTGTSASEITFPPAFGAACPVPLSPLEQAVRATAAVPATAAPETSTERRE